MDKQMWNTAAHLSGRLQQVWGSSQLCSAVADQTTHVWNSAACSPGLWNKGSLLGRGDIDLMGHR